MHNPNGCVLMRAALSIPVANCKLNVPKTNYREWPKRSISLFHSLITLQSKYISTGNLHLSAFTPLANRVKRINLTAKGEIVLVVVTHQEPVLSIQSMMLYISLEIEFLKCKRFVSSPN